MPENIQNKRNSFSSYLIKIYILNCKNLVYKISLLTKWLDVKGLWEWGNSKVSLLDSEDFQIKQKTGAVLTLIVSLKKPIFQVNLHY